MMYGTLRYLFLIVNNCEYITGSKTDDNQLRAVDRPADVSLIIPKASRVFAPGGKPRFHGNRPQTFQWGDDVARVRIGSVATKNAVGIVRHRTDDLQTE